MTDARIASPSSTAPDSGFVGSGRGFRPASRRRNRIAAGIVLAAVAVGGNLWLYASLDDSRPVLQVVRDVPAGEQITGDMLRTVEIDADPTVNLVDGDRLESLVGSYAKVRLVSGALVTPESFQATPLVAAGSSVVAIQVTDGSLPVGLRERVPVLLVIPADRSSADTGVVWLPGRVVGLPSATSSALGLLSLSVEVAVADAATVAAADDVRVVLLEASEDPAAVSGAGGPTADDAGATGAGDGP